MTVRYAQLAAHKPTYIDTSALAKLYIPEAFSEEVDAFIQSREQLFVSSLVALELRCFLARKVRARAISSGAADAVWEAFGDDVEAALFSLLETGEAHLTAALKLIGNTQATGALRALDAMHLGIARERNLPAFATSDLVQADAARAIGLEVHLFATLSVHEPSMQKTR